MTKKDHQRYVKEMEAMLLRVGAVPTPERRLAPGEVYKPSEHRDFRLETKHGGLGLNVGNRDSEYFPGTQGGSKVCFWPDLFGIFDNAKVAHAAGLDCNQFSGKWNHMWAHTEASQIGFIVAEIEDRLTRLRAPAPAAA